MALNNRHGALPILDCRNFHMAIEQVFYLELHYLLNNVPELAVDSMLGNDAEKPASTVS